MKTRANIHIDNDAYDTATAYASARGLSLGAAISELIRCAEQSAESPLRASTKLMKDEYGFLVVKGSGPAITSERVRHEAEDDLG